MLGWPGSERGASPEPAPPAPADWRDTGAEARHTFTHFRLRLGILTARLPMDILPQRGRFVPLAQFRPSSLPTLMRKVWDLAAPALRRD
jgi:A/G-specific adenine glycosylase